MLYIPLKRIKPIYLQDKFYIFTTLNFQTKESSTVS